MSCRQYEPYIIAYSLGELSDTSDLSDLQAHIESCPTCRTLYNSYTQLVSAMTAVPEPRPTTAESEALSRALAQVRPAPKTVSEPLPRNLPILVWGSLVAFVAIAGVLALQAIGRIDLVSALLSIGPGRIAICVVIAIIITSFLPIAVTARRKPLNGMTFSR
jgi:anti-sigma factor RsiW